MCGGKHKGDCAQVNEGVVDVPDNINEFKAVKGKAKNRLNYLKRIHQQHQQQIIDAASNSAKHSTPSLEVAMGNIHASTAAAASGIVGLQHHHAMDGSASAAIEPTILTAVKRKPRKPQAPHVKKDKMSILGVKYDPGAHVEDKRGTLHSLPYSDDDLNRFVHSADPVCFHFPFCLSFSKECGGLQRKFCTKWQRDEFCLPDNEDAFKLVKGKAKNRIGYLRRQSKLTESGYESAEKDMAAAMATTTSAARKKTHLSASTTMVNSYGGDEHMLAAAAAEELAAAATMETEMTTTYQPPKSKKAKIMSKMAEEQELSATIVNV